MTKKYYLYIENKKYHLAQAPLLGVTILSGDKLDLAQSYSELKYEELIDIKIPKEIERELLVLLGKLFFNMPNGIDGHDYLPSFLSPNELDGQSITFFGGSFNPWHEGHLECLRQCSKFEKNIVIIPDYSPWKENIQETPLQLLHQLSALVDTQYAIFPGFWGMESRNPTEAWISKVKVPKVNWLMGDDTFINFLKWKNIEKVVACLTKVYVVPRNHRISELQDVQDKLQALHGELEIVYLDEHPYRELSSTKLRQN